MLITFKSGSLQEFLHEWNFLVIDPTAGSKQCEYPRTSSVSLEEWILRGLKRLYSHDEVIDFETARGELFTITDLFEDNTFDFDVAFLDRFGKPSVDVICTCHLNDEYYQYTNERVLCTCDPSNSKDSCGLIYEKLETDE